jgi:hypothetical protein
MEHEMRAIEELVFVTKLWKGARASSSTLAGAHNSYSFLFFGTPGHYVMRKYNCWCKSCALVRGRGHGCVSRGRFLDVSGCLCSKVTVWKEDQFTVLPGQGIKNR